MEGFAIFKDAFEIIAYTRKIESGVA